MTMAKQAGRRTHGDGSLYQRADGMWVASLDLGYDANGKRRRWVGKSRDRMTAMQKLREARKELDSTGTVGGKSMTVAQWLDQWLETIAKPRIRPRTVAEYERCIRVHLKPRIGREKLHLLQPAQVRLMEQALAEQQTPATANNAHRCLRAALNDAMREGLITRNAAAMVTPPRSKPKPREALTAEQAKTLLAATSGTPMGSRWAFALLTGVRQGEALGLEWDRVDLKAGTADISWQLQRLKYQHGCGGTCPNKRGGNCPQRWLEHPSDFEVRDLSGTGLVLTRPKTSSGLRVIPLAPDLVKALRELRKDNISPGLVWARPDGRPVDPKDDAAAWDTMLSDVGLPDVPLHSARHTTATLLLEQGVDAEIIKQLLGHSEIVTTRGYQHVSLELARRAINQLGETLSQ